MITRTCPNCRQEFAPADARLDDHWNTATAEPAHAYCPHCDARLDSVHFDSVDLARHLTFGKILLTILWFVLFAVGVATDSLTAIGPVMVSAVGIWLALRAKLRDHRIAGWVLVIVSLALLYAANP